MRQFFPVEELARDERFHTITNRERMGEEIADVSLAALNERKDFVARAHATS